jgi:hypothetical protein
MKIVCGKTFPSSFVVSIFVGACALGVNYEAQASINLSRFSGSYPNNFNDAGSVYNEKPYGGKERR